MHGIVMCIGMVREIVYDMGDRGENVSIRKIMRALKEIGGGDIDLSYGQIRRVLKMCGFKFRMGGKKAHILKEKEVNQCARYWHVAQKIANRGKDGLPLLPEMYLDESYCHHHHTKNSTWWSPRWTRSTRGGKGARWNIIGTIKYYGEQVLMSCFDMRTLRKMRYG